MKSWTTGVKGLKKAIKYYSGSAIYSTSFNWDQPVSKEIYLDLGRVEVIAEVKLNGKICGIAWTAPFRIEVTDALKQGKNNLEIKVANTWLNRLMGDGLGVEIGSEKHTWTTINPYSVDPKFTVPGISARTYDRNKGAKPEPVASGLLGPVRILEQ